MLKTLLSIIIVSYFVSLSFSQETKLTLRDKVSGFSEKTAFIKNSENSVPPQIKKRKTVNSYFGAGYSFMIFTAKQMQDAFPALDTRSGSFLTDINLFFGFSIAQAVSLEIEPTILFTSNDKIIDYKLTTPVLGREYGHTVTNSLLALPLMLNVRFFPLYKLKTFARLFFIGGGAGAIWMKEENDIYYNDNPIGIYGNSDIFASQSSSQWQPMFRVVTGFTGSGGAFGFGGEVRYNIIPLTQVTSVPFATRQASNANSVDITLRFYFSL